jgi:sulfhydrogenase subunit beta (sulfur reductase)
MSPLIMSEKDVRAFIGALQKDVDVFAPKAKGYDNFAFEKVDSPEQVAFQYTCTILPPKKLLLPQYDVLLNFDTNGNKAEEPKYTQKKQVIFGVHSCDMNGIMRLDYAMTAGQVEPNYLARRKNTTIVGISCKPDKKCFCTSVNCYEPTKGFDVYLTYMKDQNSYVAQSYTSEGEAMLKKATGAKFDDNAKVAKAHDDIKCALNNRKINRDVASLPMFLEANQKSDYWQTVADRCVSCGNCTQVCPTCYCFEVKDNNHFAKTTGERVRTWDSCQTTDFTKVAGGEVFREKSKNRLRHRFHRKFNYMMNEYGGPFCVGCGRCCRACKADIDVVDVINGFNK